MKYYLFNHAKGRQYYAMMGDVTVLFLALAISYAIRILINNDWHLTLDLLLIKFTPWLVFVVVLHLFSLYLLGLYNLNRLINRLRFSFLIVLSVLLTGLIIGSLLFFFPRYIFGRQVLLIHLVVASILLACWRSLFHEIFARQDSVKRMAVIGNYDIAFQYIQEITALARGSIILSAVCFTGNTKENDIADVLVYKDVSTLLKSDDFDILVYDSLSKTFGAGEIQSIIEKKYHGKVVFDLPSFYKNLTGKIPLHYIDGNWLLQQEGLQGYVSKPYQYMKRLLDLLLANSLLLFLFPVGLVVSLVIKLDSKGPVIFSQERVGLHGTPFNCLKFRTMVQDAEQDSGPIWSTDNDIRVTRIGKFLRKSRLDELPQLLNIIKGDLSFVGPRPIRKHFADKLSLQIPFYDIRFSVQPGLSGWAQAHNVYAVPDGAGALEYELFYIQNMSFFLDLLTILKTTKSIFQGEGK